MKTGLLQGIFEYLGGDLNSSQEWVLKYVSSFFLQHVLTIVFILSFILFSKIFWVFVGFFCGFGFLFPHTNLGLNSHSTIKYHSMQ